jgi:hypothetical protein
MCPACITTAAFIAAGCTSGAAVFGYTATKAKWWRRLLGRISRRARLT